MSNADHLRDANPWNPITDQVDLKHLGKLAEETCELGSAVARCIIQGVNEREPVTGKVNREWLEDEIADVRANSELVIERLGLDEQRMAVRVERKKAHLRQWHGMAGSRPAPAGPVNRCPSCDRMFRDGETCSRGGCPMGGDF